MINIARLDSSADDFDSRFEQLISEDSESAAKIKNRVAEIIARVRKEGDSALLEFAARFDGFAPSAADDFEIAPEMLSDSLARISQDDRRALQTAATRIEDYHRRQFNQGGGGGWQFEDEFGSVLGERILPLSRVGVYAPGGMAAYPSSVLMCAIPARIAGVKEIIIATPPVTNSSRNNLEGGGGVSPMILAAAKLAGATKVFRVGGAHAIAAFAYGTKTIPRADKIVGPGGGYVAEAKRQVFGAVGIDSVAGPSEVFIIADDTPPSPLVAADLLAQAEHDESARVILASPNSAVLDSVAAEIVSQLQNAPRKKIIMRSLNSQGALIKTRDLDEAIQLAERIAPEHLQIMSRDADAVAEKIKSAGAIFIGENSAVVFGDYCAGGNHVLPTGGGGRFFSPLGVGDFIKRIGVVKLSKKGAMELSPTAQTLARSEGLYAHSRAAELRAKK